MLSVKKTVAKILGQIQTLSSKVNTATVRVELKDANVVRQTGKYVSVTAPTVSGYTFVCWLCATTNSWAGYVTASTPRSATSNFYVQWVNASTSSTGQITCYALYRRN